MRYTLQQSDTRPLWWVLTDTEAQIVCQFKEGAFNDTQQFTPLLDISEYDVTALPGIVAKMADWLRDNHYEIVFSSPQEITANARKSIGEQMKKAREAKGYTLRDLEKVTGIANNHISRIEMGKYNVTIDTLSVLCDALDMRLNITKKK